jgi:HEPN domain-containing protein
MPEKRHARDEKMSLAEQVKIWLDIAQDDLKSAELLLKGKQLLNAAYFCQQAVEKSIKACIQAKQAVPPKIHNLSVLAEKADILDSLDDKGKKFLIALTRFAIEARYPDHKAKISAQCSDESVRNLLEQTREMIAWLSEMSSRLQH